MKNKIYDCNMAFLPAKIEYVDEELQHTEKWHKDRCGRFTGSKITDLMSCTPATNKMPWGRPEKLLDFSKKAKKYIFAKAKERETNIVPRQGDNMNFKYGRKAEPLIIKRLMKKNKLKFVEQPYVPINNYLGASPDGALIGTISDDIGFEAKAAMNWETYYERTEVDMDSKHMDFWQVQTEMLALEVKKLYYVTSYPVNSAWDFINAEDEDADKMIKGIKNIIVDASPIHQEAILQRAEISDNAIKLYLSDSISMHDAIRVASSEYVL